MVSVFLLMVSSGCLLAYSSSISAEAVKPEKIGKVKPDQLLKIALLDFAISISVICL